MRYLVSNERFASAHSPAEPFGARTPAGPAVSPPASGLRWPRLGRRALGCLAFLGLLTLGLQVAVLDEQRVQMKDFVQEYLLARAVLDGANPYLPQPLLAARYMPPAEALPHSTPHPPLVALLSLPLGLLPFATASALWFALELGMLLGMLALAARAQGLRWSRGTTFAAFCILLLWPPVQFELLAGQLTSAVALLLVGCWCAYRAGRPRLAGVLLGGAVGIKLFPVVVAGYYLLRRQGRVLLWAAATVAATTGLAALALGDEAMVAFLVEGLPSTSLYRAASHGYSLPPALWRTFAGNATLAPLVELPWAAPWLSGLAAIVVLGVAAFAIRRARDADGEFGLALCAVVLASPLAWHLYIIVLLWPLCVLSRRLLAGGWGSPGSARSRWRSC